MQDYKPFSIKAFLLGKPLSTSQASHERLEIKQALAIFSSDAISSVAYATEEILLVFLAISALAVGFMALPAIGIAVSALLFIVVLSYRQTCIAYPDGGGAYTVAKENLSKDMGLLAAAALLIDYILTASVSITAGVAAISSVFPNVSWDTGFIFSQRVALGFLFLVLIAWVNLGGIRESARIFVYPTYLFIVLCLVLIITGFVKWILSPPSLPHAVEMAVASASVTPFILFRAFSSGCTALTGVEAISNGTSVFKKPEGKNAAMTLTLMGIILVTLFLGITSLAYLYRAVPTHDQTLISQLGGLVFGHGSLLYYALQAGTMMILLLAANTAYADFPRLASLLAKDKFFPKQFGNLGDRLVFSNGILMLTIFSGLLIFMVGGNPHDLIPLYAVGVFLSFTLSQAGMVVYAKRHKESGATTAKNWLMHAVMSAIGATATGAVFLVMTITKFHVPGKIEGAWMVLAALPVLILIFKGIHRHYEQTDRQLKLPETFHPVPFTHTAILLVPVIHRGIPRAILYAQSIDPSARAVHVAVNPDESDQLVAEWERLGLGRDADCGMKLIILPSPDRSLIRPIIDYLEEVDCEKHNDLITVIVPELVEARWWHGLLHNQTGHFLRFVLGMRRGIVVTNIPYHLDVE
jgi:amino acid transporter